MESVDNLKFSCVWVKYEMLVSNNMPRNSLKSLVADYYRAIWPVMAVQVMKFSNGGYKIRKIFA